MKRAKQLVLLFFFLGLAGAVGLIVWQGAAPVLAGLSQGSWGLLGMIPLYVVPLLAAALAWRTLFPIDQRPGFGAALHAEWIAHAINGLLPVGQIGGEVAKARLVASGVVPGAVAGAASVVDKTTQAVSQILSALLGLALLAIVAGTDGQLLPAMAASIVVLAVLVYAFYRVQSVGLFPVLVRVARALAGPASARLAGLSDGAALMEEAIRGIYARRASVLASCGGHLAERVLASAEVWLALAVMGYPVTLAEAVMLETLNQTVRSAAFFVPSALGVQEGGYVVLGLLVGLPPQGALALSLAKRGRTIATGIPALISWYFAEGRNLRRARVGGR